MPQALQPNCKNLQITGSSKVPPQPPSPGQIWLSEWESVKTPLDVTDMEPSDELRFTQEKEVTPALTACVDDPSTQR